VAIPDPTDTVTPRWHRRPEARPEEIIDAAQVVFGENGFARTKLEDVARIAGVSKGTVYLYFDSKESLFRAMVRAKVVAALTEAEEIVRSHDGPSGELLASLIRLMYGRMRRDQMARISRLVHAELSNFPELAKFYFEEVILRARRLIEEVIRRGIEAGEFRAVPHGFAARGLCSLLVQTAQVQCFFHNIDPGALTEEQALEGLIDLYLNGVLARPADLSQVPAGQAAT
jgi:AcrR family transcriptional regulator